MRSIYFNFLRSTILEPSCPKCCLRVEDDGSTQTGTPVASAFPARGIPIFSRSSAFVPLHSTFINPDSAGSISKQGPAVRRATFCDHRIEWPGLPAPAVQFTQLLLSCPSQPPAVKNNDSADLDHGHRGVRCSLLACSDAESGSSVCPAKRRLYIRFRRTEMAKPAGQVTLANVRQQQCVYGQGKTSDFRAGYPRPSSDMNSLQYSNYSA